MPTMFSIPFEVFAIGAAISAGIALLMKVMMDVIKFFTNKSKTETIN